MAKSPLVRAAGVGATAVIAGAVGGAVGWILGALFGGSYATQFQLAGQRGYEATGIVGAVIGFIVLCILGAYLANRAFKKGEQAPQAADPLRTPSSAAAAAAPRPRSAGE